MKHEFCNELDDILRVVEAIDEDSRDRDDAAEALETVVESDDLVVDWIRNDIVLVQDVEAGRGNRA